LGLDSDFHLADEVEPRHRELAAAAPRPPAFGDRVRRLFRGGQRRGTRILTGRLVRTDGTEFVVELEVPEGGFERTGAETFVLRIAGGTHRAVVVPESSTRPGIGVPGMTVRLVLRRIDALPPATGVLQRVEIQGIPGGDVVIEVEVPGA
ncbi:MAG TPA: hypothetical protein VFV33_06185, partial [Gemmatimonadaceae bacterium]|nr:hypothetical protein [Gemmatimonadaceae bacterium]